MKKKNKTNLYLAYWLAFTEFAGMKSSNYNFNWWKQSDGLRQVTWACRLEHLHSKPQNTVPQKPFILHTVDFVILQVENDVIKEPVRI